MSYRIILRTIGNLQSDIPVDRTPDRCPICHLGITPIDWTTGALTGIGAERLLQCPSAACQRLFIAKYHAANSIYMLQGCVPTEIRTPVQSETIKIISPDFCKIFIEASKAEALGLKLVAGPGYRKALEFLIKDYVISQYPEKDVDLIAAHRTQVQKKLLASCIAEHVKSDQIKEIAKRATWLGNDETHYVRKWEGKDLEDLKRLIALTIHWIEIEKLTADVIDDMPDIKTTKP